MPKIFNARKSNPLTIESYWPQWIRRLFESLKEIPWLSLTAVGTLLGIAILFCYFQSIDYFPSDFSALISLGVATAVCAIAVVLALAMGLFAPATVYRNYVSEEEALSAETRRPFSKLELIFLQLVGVGVMFALIVYPRYSDCGEILNAYGTAAIIALLLGGGACLKILLYEGTWKQRMCRVRAVAGIAIFSMTLCLVVIPLQQVFVSTNLNSTAVFLTLWILAIIANAEAANSLPVTGLVQTGALLVSVFLVVMPMAIDNANTFPKLVANFMGVRHDAAQDLRVPDKTCRLIQSAIEKPSMNADVICHENDWGSVKAQVLSNVGDQWLIEVAQTKMQGVDDSSKLRITIPRADVQVVKTLTPEALDKKKAVCSR